MDQDVAALYAALNSSISDQFSRALLEGALVVAHSTTNPIRGNLFASAMRELFNHTLHRLAPDEKVRACAWFVQDLNYPGITRKQRATYIAQGGLSDTFLQDSLHIEPDDVHGPFLDAADGLNRFVHVRENTIVADSDETKTLVMRTLSALIGLFAAAEDCRSRVRNELSEYVDEEILNRFLSEVVSDLDELSTHTTVEDHEYDEIIVTEIDERYIYFSVTGSVFVELQYGSNSDQRNDMGVIMSDSYPYSASIQSTVQHPETCIRESLVINVDNSSFFE